MIGFEHVVAVPDTQCISGQLYAFSGWSDGGGATHQITVPATDQAYTADFLDTGPCSPLPLSGLVTHLEADTGVVTSGVDRDRLE